MESKLDLDLVLVPEKIKGEDEVSVCERKKEEYEMEEDNNRKDQKRFL